MLLLQSFTASGLVPVRCRHAAACFVPCRVCSAVKRHQSVLPRTTLHAPKLRLRAKRFVAQASSDGEGKVPFGYTRKDVILVGAGLLGLGYALYYGLQAAGMDAGMAGNFVQLIIFMGICVGWIGSYLFRVANKQMTYVQQLKDYEEAVMVKRLEELPPGEADKLLEEVDVEREARELRRKAREDAKLKQ